MVQIDHEAEPSSLRDLFIILILSWLSMIGFDFFLHAGLLARFYLQPSLFLLPPEKAFRLIPIGYASFLLFASLLLWLMVRLRIVGLREGSEFGLKLGCFIWGALILGLASISTADVSLLVGWFFGQTIELGIAGAVIGKGLTEKRFTRLSAMVIVFIIFLFFVTVVLQTLGIVPAAHL